MARSTVADRPSGGARPSGDAVRSARLSNGVRVLAEEMPGAASVAVGVWVEQGGAHEPPDRLGASHLLEHMVFKGTETRTAREIALSLERLGGSLDAYTAREHTSYQARVLPRHLPAAVEVLADLVRNPLLDPDDLDREKAVVAEEIAMVEDTPEDLVFELHGERLWQGHPYGQSILGTNESVAALSRSALADLHQERYVANNLVVAAAGAVDHDRLVELADRWFGGVPAGPDAPRAAPPVEPEARLDRMERDSAQVHVVTGWTTPGYAHPDRYARLLLSAALGGGMSSLLFQHVREELALAYAVYSFQSFYSGGGLFGVYAGTRPGKAGDLLDAVHHVYDDVRSAGLPEDELERVKEQVKGRTLLALETPGARVQRLASLAVLGEPFVPLDEVARRVDAVSPEEVRRVATTVLDPARQCAVCLGPRGVSCS